MHARLLSLLTFTAVLVTALPVSRGRAQPFTAPLALEVSAAEPPPAPSWLATGGEADLKAHEARKRQRRARLILAAGLGLLLGATIHIAALAPRRHCNEGTDYAHTMNDSLYAAGFLGATGLTLALGGGTWLAVASRGDGRKPGAGQRWLAAGVGAAGAGVATSVQIMTWGLDTVGCSS